MPPRTPLRPGSPGATNWAQTIVAPPAQQAAGQAYGPMSIFVAATGWLTSDTDAIDGYVVFAIYNLPTGASVAWTADITVGGDEFHVRSCSDESVLVVNGPKNRPATITVSATVNGAAVDSATFEVETNQQPCA